MIALRRLTKHYGNIVAVADLDLEIKKGEIFALLGPNGAGKTTTIRMLTMLTRPTGGMALINGYDVTRDLDKVKYLIAPISAGAFVLGEVLA
ncbi:MAG: ATP-binding cassette domain-containing protein, partial [Desulfotomaculales bacterium]